MSLNMKIVGWYLLALFVGALTMAGAKDALIPAMGEDTFFPIFGALCIVSAGGLPAWYMIATRDPRADRFGDDMP